MSDQPNVTVIYQYPDKKEDKPWWFWPVIVASLVVGVPIFFCNVLLSIFS
jgi:hypothetical protein